MMEKSQKNGLGLKRKIGNLIINDEKTVRAEETSRRCYTATLFEQTVFTHQTSFEYNAMAFPSVSSIIAR